MNAFDRLHPALQHHIVNSLGWRDLREVQSLSIEAYLTGANLVILAPTAGGKTESAFFPVISQMLEESWTGISILYVSPIKALLNNQEERLDKYMRLVGRQDCSLARRHTAGRTQADTRRATRLPADDARVIGSLARLSKSRSPPVLQQREGRRHRRTPCVCR